MPHGPQTTSTIVARVSSHDLARVIATAIRGVYVRPLVSAGGVPPLVRRIDLDQTEEGAPLIELSNGQKFTLSLTPVPDLSLTGVSIVGGLDDAED